MTFVSLFLVIGQLSVVHIQHCMLLPKVLGIPISDCFIFHTFYRLRVNGMPWISLELNNCIFDIRLVKNSHILYLIP